MDFKLKKSNLNFRVYTAPAFPSTGNENDICVISDVPMKNWILSPDDPSGTPRTDGDVWIKYSVDDGTVNLLKTGAMMVAMASASQYVNGTWVDTEAKSYRDGAWVDWIPEGMLYLNGNQFTNLTGGWTKSSLEWSGLPTNGSILYEEYLTVNAKSGGYYDATTVNALDLTEYSQLLFDIAPDSATDDQLIVVHQKTSGIIWSGTPAWIRASNNGVLSLTGISGLCYISVLACNNKTIKVGNIRLVK